VDLSTLDITYVSSLSWYFIVSFGVNGVMQLVSGADFEFDDPMQMQMGGMNMMGGGNQMGFNASAAFRSERDALTIWYACASYSFTFLLNGLPLPALQQA
jgi:hypothetical protein